MLDKATLEWWENRDLCVKCEGFFCCMYRKSPYGLNVRFCKLYTPEWLPKTDYPDALEFEARVAVKLAYDVESYFDIVNGIRTPLSRNENAFLRIKSARLLVEQEMIREGKGPGRLEDA